MHNSQQVERECRILTRYLIGELPDGYIRRKYTAAFATGRSHQLLEHSGFDRLLLALARFHPLVTRAVDMYSRLFAPASVVRRRLVLLLAIIETWAPVAARLEQPDHAGLTGFVLGMAWRSVVSGILLMVAIPVLMPAQLLAGRQGPGG